MRNLLLILFLVTSTLYCNAQTQASYTQEDVDIFNKYVKWINKFKKDPMSSLMVKTAKFFVDKPYVGGTLEKNSQEQLVVNLREFDCTTFVETCLALSRVVQSKDMTFENYCNILREVRYRDGEIDGFSSRLHYMTDWVYDNSKKGIVRDVTYRVGGTIKNKNLHFITSHAGSYPPLKNQAEKDKMKKVEDDINTRQSLIVSPTILVTKFQHLIEDGDIVLFVSTKSGLDYYHMGISYRTLDGVKFIHASSKKKKIIIEKITIRDYIYRSKSGDQISFIRPLKYEKQ